MKLEAADFNVDTWHPTDKPKPGQETGYQLVRMPELGLRLRASYAVDEFQGADPEMKIYPVDRSGEWSIVARIPSPSSDLSWMHLGEDHRDGVTGLIVKAEDYGRGWPREASHSSIKRYVDGLLMGIETGQEWRASSGEILLHDPLLHAVATGSQVEVTYSGDLTIDGRYLADSSQHAVRTVACMAAAAAEGFSSDRQTDRIRALLPCDRELLISLATARALRTVLSRVVTACGASDESLEIWGFVGGTRESSNRPTHQIRLTLGCTAAILGSCDRVVAEPYIVEHGYATDTLRLALNVLRILRHESCLGVVVDSVRGSYYVEALTGQIVDRSWETFLAIEDGGGLRAVLMAGTLSDLLQSLVQGPE